MSEMKAITIWQPWASLVACGAKQFETRSWSTSYRGPIAIHAAAKKPAGVLKEMFPLGAWNYHPDFADKRAFLKTVMLSLFPENTSTAEDYEYLAALESLSLGCVIATAEIVECWEIHTSDGRGVNYKDVYINKPDPSGLDGVTWISGNERLFGNFTPGRYAWELRNVVMLPEPISAKGSQRLWNWDDGA